MLTYEMYETVLLLGEQVRRRLISNIIIHYRNILINEKEYYISKHSNNAKQLLFYISYTKICLK